MSGDIEAGGPASARRRRGTKGSGSGAGGAESSPPKDEAAAERDAGDGGKGGGGEDGLDSTQGKNPNQENANANKADAHPFQMKTPQQVRSQFNSASYLDGVAQSPIKTPVASAKGRASAMSPAAHKYLSDSQPDFEPHEAAAAAGGAGDAPAAAADRLAGCREVFSCFLGLPMWLYILMALLTFILTLFLVGGLVGGAASEWLFMSDYVSSSFFSAGTVSFGIFTAASSLSLGMFSTGLVSVGVFSVGFFSVGVFSVGVFSVGLFSIGHIVLGLFAFGSFPFVYAPNNPLTRFPRKGTPQYEAVPTVEADPPEPPTPAAAKAPVIGLPAVGGEPADADVVQKA